MSASAWQDAPPAARVLCAGEDLGDLIQMQCCLDGQFDFVIITSAEEATAALMFEDSFDVLILDQRLEQLGGGRLLERLRRHSPDAERLIVVHRAEEISKMLESECRVMRLLPAPFAADALCSAVADALLRHRARALRASALPRVTPMGGNPCCTAPKERT
jgi:DNA-binding NtrC family response regulator